MKASIKSWKTVIGQSEAQGDRKDDVNAEL